LLGERASIPRGLTDDFNDAGISHLVAISGYNVMLVAGLALGCLSPLAGRRYAILASMALVVLFALFVGATPSVLRAAVMAEVLLGASLAGRPNSARDAVFLAGAGLTAVQPWIIDDVSFQLSFAATLGIVLLAKPLKERLRTVLPGVTAMLAEPAAMTIAASVAAQPVIAASFGRVSLVSLPANLLAVPAFPVIMACSAVTSVVGVISQGAGRMAGEVTYLPLAYLVWLGRGAADLQGSAHRLNTLGSLAALGLILVSGALLFVVARRRALPLPDVPAVPRLSPALWASLVVFLIAAFVWRDTLSASQAQLTVSVLDVGQGDAILIQTPAGQRILVDGGPSANRLNQALGRELPASAHRIDLIVLTHGQDDHVTGLVSVLTATTSRRP
jgi:competence protein ComEC